METQTLYHSTSLVGRLAQFFRARPGVWIDGRDLAAIAGYAAWRTKTSELRRPPHNMTIENRQRHPRTAVGTVTVSEYRFVPEDAVRSVAHPVSGLLELFGEPRDLFR